MKTASTICITLLWLLLAIVLPANASEQRQFLSDYQTEFNGESIQWSQGEQVSVLISGADAYIKYVLANGSSTMVKIPVSVLEPIPPAETAVTPAETTTPETPPANTEKAAAPAAATDQLTLVDGTSIQGQIIRVEERMVVVILSDDTVEDIPLKSLDEDSTRLIKDWDQDPIPDPRVVAGRTIRLELGDIGASNQSDPASFTVRIPDNYNPDQPSPLILWLAGGKGSDNCNGAKAFVDPAEYILVAFPYPAAYPSPVKAIGAGNMDKVLDFQKPMLERLQALIPNTHTEHRIAVGFSNGAHTIASAVCDDWEEFQEYFTGFVMHEGGNSETKDYSDFRKKDVLVGMGADSQYRGFSESVVRRLEGERVKPEVFASEGEKHTVGANTKAHIKTWIAERLAEIQ